MKKLTGLIVSSLQGWLKRNMVKKAVLFLSAAILLSGCHSYFKINSSTKPSTEKIYTLDQAGKNFIIHYGAEKWILNSTIVKNDTIYGSIQDYNRTPTLKPIKYKKPNRYKHDKMHDQRFLLNEVHLYLDKPFETGKKQIAIPVNTIQQADIYDKDTKATAASTQLTLFGATAGAIGAGIGLYYLLKESCPFIYTRNGKNYDFAGEIYSGSIHKPLERDDYLKLPYYPDQKTYSIKMTNEVMEKQHTNLLELIIVDHPENSDAMIDKYGKVCLLTMSSKPLSAKSLKGKDVLPLVSYKDELFYQSISTDSIKDGIVLEFPNKNPSEKMNLTIHAKNSILLDYSLGQLLNSLGFAYARYMKNQQRASASNMHRWSLDQGIPLSLFVERDGKWELEDYYNVAGPMKLKDDVLCLTLKGNESDPIRIKLEYGNFLWEIDYAALSYPGQEPVTVERIPLKTAVTEEGVNDLMKLLTNDDEQYFNQAPMEKTALLTFDLPEMNNQKRSVFLHSKGWYQIIRKPAGMPKFHFLKTFRQPGQFNRFVNEQVTKMQLQALQKH